MLVEIKNFLIEKTMFKEEQIISSNFLKYSLTTGKFPEIMVREINKNLVEIFIVMSIMDIDNKPINVSSFDEFKDWFNKNLSMFFW
jgi:hypothetical protein